MKIALLSEAQDAAEVLESLALLNHDIVIYAAEAKSVRSLAGVDLVIIDATGSNVLRTRDFCRAVAAAHPTLPVAIAIEESSVVAVDSSWAVDDFLLPTASPAEIDARIRLLLSRRPVPVEEAEDSSVAVIGDVVVDELTYVARVGGTALDLTYKEFELLYFLVKHAGRVFSREQLLQDVWGYDYFGGVRTVDVHVRRLRAKLGHEHEQLIATVRNVGYKAIDPEDLVT